MRNCVVKVFVVGVWLAGVCAPVPARAEGLGPFGEFALQQPVGSGAVGGTLNVMSTVGEGTTITISLPLNKMDS